MSDSDELDALFAADGALARAIPGYRPRAQQLEMARLIAKTFQSNGVLVAEAGTGTGKTLAYLVPALLSGGKVILSTGTKTLQDQLFRRDLPAVRDALARPASVALLKGRSNYVCHHHLSRALVDGRFQSRETADHLRRIVRFAKSTRTGDKADCADVPEDSPAWLVATSTRENCLGQECSQFRDCFIMAARREAQEADVVVVNHHLFFADVMLRDEGVAELLPACNAVVFDEAHQLPETATLFFGESVTTGQILDLARDTRAEALVAARDFAPLPVAIQDLERAARELRLALAVEPQRYANNELSRLAGFAAALTELDGRLTELGALLEIQAERSEDLAACWRRAGELSARLARWQDPEAPDLVRWAECFSQSLALNATPLVVADVFKRQMDGHPRAWVFTSATLAIEGDFSHFCGELGLEHAETGCWGSPFDYAKRGLLYVPQGLPEPSHADYSAACAQAAYPLIRAAGGGAFVLCTSLRAMRRIHEALSQHFDADGCGLPLLIQGECSRSELLSRFRQLGNAVLVASQSFWEGVDVRGEALRLVVIDKLPFAPPDDPVLSARLDYLRRSGRDPFSEYQVPRAVISIKQGAGRLIRDENDRGVLMLCDPRVVSRGYGRRFWRSLPPMRRTRDAKVAESFFLDSALAD